MSRCTECNIELRGTGAPKYCLKCARHPRPKIGSGKQPRATKVVQGGVVVCIHCSTPTKNNHYTPISCWECNKAIRLVKNTLGGQGRAHMMVSKARREGILPDPKTLTCTDCPRPAEQYDHRDYGKPLEVDPVCRSCNSIRGPGLWADRAAQAKWAPRFPHLQAIFGTAEQAAA